MEGFCSMVSGFYGTGHATTTYGGNIGAIGMTKVWYMYFIYFQVKVTAYSGRFSATLHKVDSFCYFLFTRLLLKKGLQRERIFFHLE